MPQSASPSTSLFASDYSLSPHPSPPPGRYPSPNPSVHNRRTHDNSYARGSLAGPDQILLQPLRSSISAPNPSRLSPLPVVFPQAKHDGVFLNATTPSISPAPSPALGTPPLSPSRTPGSTGIGMYSLPDRLTHAPTRPSATMRRMSRKQSMMVDSKYSLPSEDRDSKDVGIEDDDAELDAVPVLMHHEQQKPQRPLLWSSHPHSSSSSRRGSSGYRDFESCMEGHETKSASYKPGTEKAYHHLQRSNDLFGQALILRPGYPKGMLAKSKVLIQLAMNYQPPKVAALSLREAVVLLRDLVGMAPKSVSARETLAQACALLSGMLAETETEDLGGIAGAGTAGSADDEVKTWEGAVGSLAREALAQLEDVAADKMDKMRTMKQKEAAECAPAMAEMFLALSSAAITVSTLAVDLPTVDLHVELAEQALDQASNMSTVAASARVKSSTSSANLITRVQLASGRSSLERLRHTFLLGTELDEDDFRSLMADMSMLATECRERAAKLKGSKAAASSTLAWEAIKQLGDAKVTYASLLRLVWRKRAKGGRGGRGTVDAGPRKLSQRTASAGSVIQEENEDEGEEDAAAPISQMKMVSLNGNGPDDRRANGGSGGSISLRPSVSRKGSQLDSLRENVAYSTFTPPSLSSARSSSGSIASPLYSPSFSAGPGGATGRRGSWLPEPNSPATRSRRQSSMSAPLTGPDGISAWTRKASVITLGIEEQVAGLVPSSELAGSAWQLLESGVKQYKLALTLLSTSDLPMAQMAKGKADTLTQIAYASWFQASLAPRVAIAAEKRTSLLVTAEVYATWAAREVGWSFLIEGTKEAALADRRTNSWRADEAGKRAVMLLLRIWWHRAVTTESMDTDTKSAAKDAVEVVVRRMRDKEGVKDQDVGRWKSWLGRVEGEMDAAEVLFWRSVSRILRGGAGFVMS